MTGYKHILNTRSKHYSKNVYTAKASYKQAVLEKEKTWMLKRRVLEKEDNIERVRDMIRDTIIT